MRIVSGYACARFLWAALAVAASGVPNALAQGSDYRPGERILYKENPNREVWEEGTFVEKSYDGTQPVIRFKPDQFFPKGEQKALASWAQIRHLQATPHAEGRAEGNPPPPESRASRNQSGKAAPVDRPAAPLRSDGGGTLSQADIIAFMKARLGPDPFANPRQGEVKAELAAEVRRRGLSFHFNPISPFFNELSQYTGVTTDLSFPLKDNYGAPTKLAWLSGAWRLDKVGATTEFVQGGYLWRQEASAFANIGKLTISPEGTYVWQSNAPTATFRGSWRKATAEEMKTQGGDGIVLLNAKQAFDWIVTQNRAWADQGDVVWISDLATRQIREVGSRGLR